MSEKVKILTLAEAIEATRQFRPEMGWFAPGEEDMLHLLYGVADVETDLIETSGKEPAPVVRLGDITQTNK